MQKSLRFIGIDISKQTLDICILEQGSPQHYQILNQLPQIKKFFKKLNHEISHVCFENTGKYGWKLINALSKTNINFYQVNALHLKRSMGLVRGKNDIVDALRITQFIAKNHTEIHVYQPKEKSIEKIQILIAKRKLLVKQRAQHKALKKENKLLKDLK